ncbi:hypothetical protein DIS24_g1244 [Lasiodiplodia hormozganensis]|uniref:GST N-terminal domain-containing protein n=1 Tax=Lasiodiplodia hormozganensis TaxID=869390 RepID=A0AA40D7C1_9PEZI|nr:hypothetical protein DIS24_g1244 [Lasiodiplodia hormozganensis]
MAADKQHPPPITLFCYPGSPYSRRISWYLDLRRIPYATSIQPPILPRPLLQDGLRLRYRRIPVLAVGGSVLCDTRLILAKLDRLFPPSEQHPALLPPSPTAGGLAKMLEHWTTASADGLFVLVVGLIPPSSPMLSDPAFLRDREELLGGGLRLDGADVAAKRPACRAAIEAAMGVVESTFLADGREWLLDREQTAAMGGGPSLADLQGVWVFDWLLCDPFLKGALGSEEEVRGVEERFPRTVAWVRRWRAWLREKGAWDAEREGPRGAIGDEEVLERVFGSAFVEDGEEVVWDEQSARVVGLEKGLVVEVFPTDYGSAHKDQGRLVGLGIDEVVIDVDVEERGKAVRLHFPRTGFCVRKV